MIALVEVSKRYRARGEWREVLRGVSAVFPSGRNIGVLGRNGAGKSTLMRLLAGAERPDSGEIRRDVRVSWPLGFSGGLQGSLSGRDNARFVARIYRADVEAVEEYVADFAELGPYFDMPVSTYSAGMRARLALGLSFAVDFDIYLVDELPGVGDARFARRYETELTTRKTRSNFIIVSHNPAVVRAQCDMAAVLHNGTLAMFDDVAAAMRLYMEL
jgi:capsular polysaccharide transport system ATP-binding protein